MAVKVLKITQLQNSDLSSDLNRPLVVDLDGTLFVHDIFQLQLFFQIFKNPLVFIKLIFMTLAGYKAKAKSILRSTGIEINPNLWPKNQFLEEKLIDANKQGRQIYICSGANEDILSDLVANLDYVFDYWGSTQSINLTGERKAKFLVSKFGQEGFDYIGNSKEDIHVYQKAKNAYSTNAFIDNKKNPESAIRLWFKQLRVKHWAKNLLVFLPIIAAHDFSVESVTASFVFFVSLCCLASGTYVLNDLLDLLSDVQHKEKKFRPLASGAIPLSSGIIVALFLIFMPLFASLFTGKTDFFYLLATYLLATLFYSVKGKKILGLDVVLLALLYTYRIFAGTLVISAAQSAWLLALSFLIFSSMASAKRFIEVSAVTKASAIPGRGYLGIDSNVIAQVGVSSGISSIVVYVLYATSSQVSKAYEYPLILLLATPILLYWVIHLWTSVNRGSVASDPIDWAFKDKSSWASIIGFVSIILIAWSANFI